MEALEKSFASDDRPGTVALVTLAKEVDDTVERVRAWFTRRRATAADDESDSAAESADSSKRAGSNW